MDALKICAFLFAFVAAASLLAYLLAPHILEWTLGFPAETAGSMCGMSVEQADSAYASCIAAHEKSGDLVGCLRVDCPILKLYALAIFVAAILASACCWVYAIYRKA